ncbi:MAG: hypothetical protein EWV49_00680 [Microcystis aeruginosa Ma_QC_Ch_20071001_S25]|uniref:Type II toxin-antitoxin system mRNA interferase toxin, RelE/StbE family n=3 Tax=Microcystis aeruginosa TaxID=1126 RepID=A0A552DA01_MICAE|nr:MAG: hypothetical protein EWV82_00190 [Microcystis aeruginosa Ma_AC_P_19900807_S299]TRU19037.1 MAG: hypothetical protein EWV80_19925 [Microcystis aeruginosa Ma_QC_B_20070730_S2]TRU28447.1 MAG: hypothetical protein EWV81_05115 [Microcystis aeruginosa Ma_SC_T_19800800_S464]TRU50559.1 MAG: hypothetical protein EWV57_10185 [Microcystis aeruginosa Ma_QC_Ch_20071001_S25D]TRU54898.1 MAG: hypothetical protein EWV49_00680 [Microcystis aeruginosa Ma_QC_Ch_20071001_S25]TRU60212.1 MAG: hypothetical pro
MQFSLILSARVTEQLNSLPLKTRDRYCKAFYLITSLGPEYRSLRTHRYHERGGKLWGSSASMSLRFYWYFQEKKTIVVVRLDSH